MTRYARGTTVPVQRSIAELQALASRFGAKRFGYATDDEGSSVITFATDQRAYRLEVNPSEPEEHKFTPTGQLRGAVARSTMARDETARRWRSLALLMKALLVAVDDGLMDTQTALLPWTLLPDGTTIGQWAGPALDDAYGSGSMAAITAGGRR